jgi:glycerophosphoryl diester phosphodiesterase
VETPRKNHRPHFRARSSVVSAVVSALVASSALSAALAHAESPEVYAHRGVRAYLPENTLPAYEAALRMGTDWVDVDVVLTRDGEVLVSHDPILSRDLVRDESGRFLAPSPDYARKYAVKNLTLAELSRFDVGRLNPESAYAKFFPDQVPQDGLRMPTLREVIRLTESIAPGKIGFQIEMKTDPLLPEFSADPRAFAEALAKVLREEKVVARSEVQAFDFRCLRALQEYNPKLKTAYLTSTDNLRGGVDDFLHADPEIAGRWTGGRLLKDYEGSIPKMVKALGGFAWEPEDAQLTKAALAEAHALGLKVVVWTWPEKRKTAFDTGLTAKMIDWGVDGIITDDPRKLNALLARRGLRVPRAHGCPELFK